MIRFLMFILGAGSLLGPTLLFAAAPPSASEILSLPRFCWGQYNAAIKDTGVGISNCGVGMNHYCDSVLGLNRSYSSRDQFRRTQHLTVALREVEYTLGWMKDYPNCSIREDVLKTYARVRTAFVGVGKPIPPDRFSGQWGSPAKPSGSSGSSAKSEGRQTEANKKAPESMQGQASKPADQAAASSPAEKAPLAEAAASSKNAQPTDSTKIGTPSNPYCRFCPPE